MVKRLRKWLKIGVQSGFGPKFNVEFEEFFQKKNELAYYPLGSTQEPKEILKKLPGTQVCALPLKRLCAQNTVLIGYSDLGYYGRAGYSDLNPNGTWSSCIT